MWESFKWNGLNVEAKVYGEGSSFGINGGRVSKLMVYNNHASILPNRGAGWLLNYDRSWDFCELSEVEVAEIVAEAERRMTPEAYCTALGIN